MRISWGEGNYDKNLNFVTRLLVLEKMINHQLFFKKPDLSANRGRFSRQKRNIFINI